MPPITMTNLQGTLWILLILVGSYHQTTAQRVRRLQHYGSKSESYSDRKEVQSQESSQQKMKRHSFADLIKTWHGQEDQKLRRSPLWNPMLVKLIHRYLLSHKMSPKDSKGTFFGAFKQLSYDQRNSRLKSINSRKNQQLKFLEWKSFGDENLKQRVKRFAKADLSRKGTDKKPNDPITARTANSPWLNQSSNDWMLPEDPGVSSQGMDFTIPLHSPSRPPTGSHNFAWTNTGNFQLSPITNNHNRQRKKREVFSSFQKYRDPFHPLAYPIRKYGTTGNYGDEPLLHNRKHTNHARRSSLKSSGGYQSENRQNFDFYENPFGSSSSKFLGKNDYDFSNFKGERSLYPSFGDFPYNQNSKSVYGFPGKKNYGGHHSSGIPAGVDVQSLFALYSNIIKNAQTGSISDVVGTQAQIDTAGLTQMVDVTQATTPAVIPLTQQIITVTQVPPNTQTVPSTTQTVSSTTQTVPITVPRTANPCDGLFTSGASSYGRLKHRCYYVPPTTSVNTMPEPATTTPCYVTHEPGVSYPHYHMTHKYPKYEPTHAEPIWSEFEIIQEGLWETNTPKPSISTHQNTDREFLITPPPPVSRFKITDPPSYVKGLPQDYAESVHHYPAKHHKKTHITGTIELKKDKNNKPSYIVKLPFDTGQLPFAIRRLIISKFTDWSRNNGARNAASVTMNPNCSPWNASCSLPSPSADSNNVDIVIEVDPTLFDKGQFYKAFLSAHTRPRTALDLEELEPLWRHSSSIRGNRQELQENKEYNNHMGKHNIESMSPSTEKPVSIENDNLPAETPDWLRNIINHFTKQENWDNDLKGNQVNRDRSPTVPRLLPAKDPYELDNYLELLPQHMALSSRATCATKATLHPFVLIVLLQLYLTP